MRFKVVIAYDGTDFYGWQSQAGGNTIQDYLEERLAVVFKETIRIHGSGRTDSGVHARGQVAHFDAEWRHGTEKLHRAMSVGIPEGIQIVSVREAKPDFHARFSATGKRYSYTWNEGQPNPFISRFVTSTGHYRLDESAMHRAAQALLGTHDFTAYAASRGDGTEEDPVKTLYKMEIRRNGKQVRLITEGSGYLYKMVRSMAGALQEVGCGKMREEQIAEILESKERTSLVVTALARGLTLEKVFYSKKTHAGK